MTLANKITIARILLIPVFVLFAVYYGKGVEQEKATSGSVGRQWPYFLSRRSQTVWTGGWPGGGDSGARSALCSIPSRTKGSC